MHERSVSVLDNIVDDRPAVVVNVRVAKSPSLLISDHRVKLMDSCDKSLSLPRDV